MERLTEKRRPLSRLNFSSPCVQIWQQPRDHGFFGNGQSVRMHGLCQLGTRTTAPSAYVRRVRILHASHAASRQIRP